MDVHTKYNQNACTLFLLDLEFLYTSSFRFRLQKQHINNKNNTKKQIQKKPNIPVETAKANCDSHLGLSFANCGVVVTSDVVVVVVVVAENTLPNVAVVLICAIKHTLIISQLSKYSHAPIIAWGEPA